MKKTFRKCFSTDFPRIGNQTNIHPNKIQQKNHPTNAARKKKKPPNKPTHRTRLPHFKGRCHISCYMRCDAFQKQQSVRAYSHSNSPLSLYLSISHPLSFALPKTAPPPPRSPVTASTTPSTLHSTAGWDARFARFTNQFLVNFVTNQTYIFFFLLLPFIGAHAFRQLNRKRSTYIYIILHLSVVV